MNFNRLFLFSATAVTLSVYSCGKDDDSPVPVTGGKGGSATLKVNTFHHERRIDSITVYIKYASQELPGDGKYDDSARVVKAPADTVAVFPGLKAGSYYLYGNGQDPIYGNVHGGLPIKISTDTSSVVIRLPVSEEGH